MNCTENQSVFVALKHIYNTPTKQPKPGNDAGSPVSITSHGKCVGEKEGAKVGGSEGGAVGAAVGGEVGASVTAGRSPQHLVTASKGFVKTGSVESL